MQMLCFRFVSYKDVLSDGGRCFKGGGVHLSPLGFAACQSKKCTNRGILM